MICFALTGITRQVIQDLIKNRIRTVEIRSPHNFYTLQGVDVGDPIFVTPASHTDVIPGTSGLITRVNELQIMTHRMVQSGENYYEEIESQAARAQLQLVSYGRVRTVKGGGFASPMSLEVDEVRYCDAR
ncbi:MAG: DUF473 domain-containing protein [Methanosarcinales archaeon]|nr:DUF473 domain-containing protein [Methanosarcinales archaeon]